MFKKRSEPTETTTPATEPAPTPDDPEPTRTDQHGFISRSWTAWEWRAAERRLHPEGRAEANARAQLEQRLDGQIADAMDLVDGAARQKIAIAERLRQAHQAGGDSLVPGGSVTSERKSGPAIREIEEQLEEARQTLARAKEFEHSLRQQRLALAPRRVSFQMVDHMGVSS